MFGKPKRKTNNQKINKLKLRIGKSKIDTVKTIKYLGVTFDEKGTYKQQTKLAIAKGKQVAGAAAKILKSKLVVHRVKMLLYQALIRSRVGYAAQIWLKNRKRREEVEVFERHVFRTILGVSRNPLNGHYIRNELLYDCINTQKFRDYFRLSKNKFKERDREHILELLKVFECPKRRFFFQ